MDESVVKAMQTWPNVPDVYDWLRLDGRGQWHLRNGRVTNPALIAFIGRNYVRLENGGYAFQNGPQRVHVALEATPWILHTQPGDVLGLEDQTGQTWAAISTVWLADSGEVVFERAVAGGVEVGRLRDTDLMELMPHFHVAGQSLSDDALAAALDAPDQHVLHLRLSVGDVPCRKLDASDLATHFGFITQPRRPG